jgi:predicted lipoprotein with Yx(FWY)xxD motif
VADDSDEVKERRMTTRLVRRALPLALLAALGAGVAVAATTAHSGTVSSAANARYGALLVSASGRTLYHMTSEKRGKIACTASCAKVWPPLVVAKGTKPTAGTGVKQAKLGTIKRPDGSIQVTYNGYALYRYADDKKRGDVKGEDVEHVWFAISPAGKLVKVPAGGTTGSTTTTTPTTTDDDGGMTTTTGGYGYG